MFPKAIVVLLLASSAIAGAIPEGIYRITNVAFPGIVRIDNGGDPLYVSSGDPSNPINTWAVWNDNDNGYIIENAGIPSVDKFAEVRQPAEWEPVFSNRNPTVFDIESAGDNTFVIKVQNDDLLWNADPERAIVLRYADGTDQEKWFFTSV